MTEAVDKFLLKLDQEEKIREFADTICDTDAKAKAFVRTCGEFLEWNGNRLMFRAGEGTKLPVHHDPHNTAMKFFREKFDFLLTPERKAPEGAQLEVKLDPATVASARAGNLTAKGALARALGGGDDTKGAAAVELFLKGEAVKSGDVVRNNVNGRTTDNPFTRLRSGGVIDPAVRDEIAAAIKTEGIGKVSAWAKEAGMTLGGMPLQKRFG